MAEPTIKDLIKLMQMQIRADAQDADNSVRASNEIRNEVAQLNKLLAKYFLAQKAAEGDKLEAEREKRSAKDGIQRQKAKKGDSKGFDWGLMGLGGLAPMLAPLTGGLAALGAAFAGLRGWELDAIKKIDVMKLVPNQLSNAVIRIRNSAYRLFGLTPEGLVTRDPETGRFAKARPISEQIAGRMKSLRANMLRVFGLGVDGKPIAIKDPDGLFTKNIIGRVTFQIGRLLKPLMNISAGVADFAKGAGEQLFKFLGAIGATGGGSLAKIAGFFGKLLKPIGFIFSMKAAYDEWVSNDKESILEKTTDTISAFFGDFVGAPLGLLSDLTKKLLTALGYDVLAKKLPDGDKVVEGITNAFKFILDLPREIVNYLGGLFTDAEFRKEQYDKFKEKLTSWGSSLVSWVANLLPDVSALTGWVQAKAKNILPEGLYDYWFGEDEVSMDTGPSSRGGSYRKRRKAEKDAVEEEKAALAGLAQFAGEDMILSYREARKAMNEDLMGFREAVRPYAELVGKDVGTYTRELASGAFNKQGLDLRLPQNPAASAPIVIDNTTNNQGGSSNTSLSTTMDMVTNPDFAPFVSTGL